MKHTKPSLKRANLCHTRACIQTDINTNTATVKQVKALHLENTQSGTPVQIQSSTLNTNTHTHTQLHGYARRATEKTAN